MKDLLKYLFQGKIMVDIPQNSNQYLKHGDVDLNVLEIEGKVDRPLTKGNIPAKTRKRSVQKHEVQSKIVMMISIFMIAISSFCLLLMAYFWVFTEKEVPQALYHILTTTLGVFFGIITSYFGIKSNTPE